MAPRGSSPLYLLLASYIIRNDPADHCVSAVNATFVNRELRMKGAAPCLCFAAGRALAVYQKTPGARQPVQGRGRQQLPGLHSAPQDCKERRDPADSEGREEGSAVSPHHCSGLSVRKMILHSYCLFIFLKKLIYFMCLHTATCMYVHRACQLSLEVRRGYWVLWNWAHGLL